jgi:hypothetical protein
MDPDEAERRFAEMLEEARLPRFASTLHDPETNELQLTWEHGVTLHVDLGRELTPIDDWERAAILGFEGHEPVHVTVSGSADDPRTAAPIPGVVIHRRRRCIRTTSPRSTASPSRLPPAL